MDALTFEGVAGSVFVVSGMPPFVLGTAWVSGAGVEDASTFMPSALTWLLTSLGSDSFAADPFRSLVSPGLSTMSASSTSPSSAVF